MKFYCIADGDTVRGFRLAGIDGEAADGPEETARAVERAARRPEVGVPIMTDVVAEGIRALVDTIRMERERPLIVEIPGPEGRMPGRKTLRQFVQEAVGISVGEEDTL